VNNPDFLFIQQQPGSKLNAEKMTLLNLQLTGIFM
jgi:hypothetical protein